MAVYTSPEGFLAASTIYSRPLANPDQEQNPALMKRIQRETDLDPVHGPDDCKGTRFHC